MGANVTRTDPKTGKERTYYKADDGKLYNDYNAAAKANMNPIARVKRFAGEQLRKALTPKPTLGAAPALAPKAKSASAPIRPGVTFVQGKPVKSPAAIAVEEQFKQNPNRSTDNVKINNLGSLGGGMAMGPDLVYIGDNKLGGDITTYAHELAHLTDPKVNGNALQRLGQALTGKGVNPIPLSGVDQPAARLTRAVTRPSKSDLLSTYVDKSTPIFEAEVYAQAGMRDFMKGLDSNYDPEARATLPGESPDSPAAADGWNYSHYPSTFMEKAITEADRLGYSDNGSFNRKVAEVRNKYNTYMRDKMGTTYSPNPYK